MKTEEEHEITKKIGQNLFKLRKSKNLSQADLARAAGITFQQIQKYELGTNRMSGVRFVQFSKALNVSITAFFEGVVGEVEDL